MNGVVKYILLFFLMVVLQSVIFNNIVLFGAITPMLLIYFIIKLPSKLNVLWVMTIAFVLGLSVDIWSNTLGMNAFACVLTAFVRIPFMRLFYGFENDTNDYVVGLARGRAVNFLKYAVTMSMLYCAIIFVVQAFTLFNFWLLLYKIIFSAVVTTLLILAFDSISIAGGGKRL